MCGIYPSAFSNGLGLPLPKRNVFVSYFHGDQTEANTFVDDFAVKGHTFTPFMVNDERDYGIDLINSTDSTYVMRTIRERLFQTSTVTIILLGNCTHSRKYIDWEIKASLQQGGLSGLKPNGLIGIILPSAGTSVYLPERFSANWNKDHSNCYARFYSYPQSTTELRGWIEDAFSARTTRAQLINNCSDIWGKNRECLLCKKTH